MENITGATNAGNDLVTLMSDFAIAVGTSISTITECIAGIPACFTPPPGIFSFGSVSIKPPTVTPPSVDPPPDPSNVPPDPSTEPAVDICHLDMGIFGSIMKLLMKAISMLVTNMIDSVISALKLIIKMILVVCDSISALKEWLKTTYEAVWAKVKEMSNKLMDEKEKEKEIKKDSKKTDEEKNKASIKEKLWDRAIKWFNSIKEKLGVLLNDLSIAVFTLIADVCEFGYSVSTKIAELLKFVAKIPEDVVCLIKVSTSTMKTG